MSLPNKIKSLDELVTGSKFEILANDLARFRTFKDQGDIGPINIILDSLRPFQADIARYQPADFKLYYAQFKPKGKPYESGFSLWRMDRVEVYYLNALYRELGFSSDTRTIRLALHGFPGLLLLIQTTEDASQKTATEIKITNAMIDKANQKFNNILANLNNLSS